MSKVIETRLEYVCLTDPALGAQAVVDSYKSGTAAVASASYGLFKGINWDLGSPSQTATISNVPNGAQLQIFNPIQVPIVIAMLISPTPGAPSTTPMRLSIPVNGSVTVPAEWNWNSLTIGQCDPTQISTSQYAATPYAQQSNCVIFWWI